MRRERLSKLLLNALPMPELLDYPVRTPRWLMGDAGCTGVSQLEDPLPTDKEPRQHKSVTIK